MISGDDCEKILQSKLPNIIEVFEKKKKLSKPIFTIFVNRKRYQKIKELATF